MFAVYNSPLWKDKDPKSRITRTFVSGLVCYILMYSTTYTNYVKSKEIIMKNRKYLGYFLALDVGITLYYHKKSSIQKKSVIDDFTDYIPTIEHYPTQYSNPKIEQQVPIQIQQPLLPIQQPLLPIPVQPTLLVKTKKPVNTPKPSNQDDLFIKIDTHSDEIIDIDNDLEDIPIYNKQVNDNKDIPKEESIPIYVSKASQ